MKQKRRKPRTRYIGSLDPLVDANYDVLAYFKPPDLLQTHTIYVIEDSVLHKSTPGYQHLTTGELVVRRSLWEKWLRTRPKETD